jgi:hypothetical protein
VDSALVQFEQGRIGGQHVRHSLIVDFNTKTPDGLRSPDAAE